MKFRKPEFKKRVLGFTVTVFRNGNWQIPSMEEVRGGLAIWLGRTQVLVQR